MSALKDLDREWRRFGDDTLRESPPGGFGFIYEIRIAEKSYIGQTIHSVHRRVATHSCAASNCAYLHRAILKYGLAAISVRRLGMFLAELLNLAERAAIAERGALAPGGYNLTTGGCGLGVSDATRAKMSAAHTGATHTMAARANMSAAQIGRTATAATRAKLSIAHTGHVHSAATRAKMSVAHTGRSVPAATRAKISATSLGRKIPPEAHIRMLEGQRRWREEARLASGIARGSKRCPRCGEVLKLSEFVVDTRQASGRGTPCRACERSRSAARRRQKQQKEAT